MRWKKDVDDIIINRTDFWQGRHFITILHFNWKDCVNSLIYTLSLSLSLRNPNLYKDIRCWVYRPCHSCYTNWLFNWNYLHACLWIFWKLNLWNVVWKEIFCLISGPGVCYPNTAHRNSSPGRKDYTQLQGENGQLYLVPAVHTVSRLIVSDIKR